MLTVTRTADNRVELALDGSLSAEDMSKGLDDLLELSEGVSKGGMLYSITNFAMPSLGAFGVELRRLPRLFGLLAKYERCAVLTDQQWLKTAASIEGALIPGLDIKCFDLHERSEAESWLDAKFD